MHTATTSHNIIDFDVSDDINTTAAVTILGVAVPDYTITPSSTTRTNTSTTGTVTHHAHNEIYHSHYVSEPTTTLVPTAPPPSLMVVTVAVLLVFGKV